MANNGAPYKRFFTPDPARVAARELNNAFDDAREDSSLNDHITVLSKVSPPQGEGVGAVTETSNDTGQSMLETDIESSRIAAREARIGAPVLAQHSDRNDVRLLIITRDASVFHEGSITEKRVLTLAQTFSEIHIVLLSIDVRGVPDTVRLTQNVWVYRTNSKYWWKTMFDAYRIVKEQLVFAGGFRADIVIAEDSSESGMVATFVARKHERPLQVHILEDMYDPEFKTQDEHNWLRLYMTRFVLSRTESVRTKSEYLRDEIIADHSSLKDTTEVLPLYRDLQVWRDLQPTFSLHERYPQFKFILLHVSSMRSRSHTKEIIIGSAPMLMRYPSMGLVILGNGPLRTSFEKLVIMLGIQNQVEFEPMPQEYISHMKSASILIHCSEDPEEDDVVLAAASVRLPLIVGSRGIGGELFKDGESAFVCGNSDSNCLADRINRFLNDNLARSQLGLNAQAIVFQRIKQDYDSYLQAYRESIERGIISMTEETQ